MSNIQLDWHFDEDPPPSSKPISLSRHRPRRWALLASGVAALAIATAGWALRSRTQAGLEEIDRQIQHVVEIEVRGLSQGDVARVQSVTDPDDHEWQSWQAQQAVNGLGGTQAVGYAIRPLDLPELTPIQWRNGLPVVTVTTWYSATLGDGSLHRLGLQTEQIYERKRDRWVRLAPAIPAQQPTQRRDSIHLQVYFTSGDRQLMERLSDRLTAYADAICTALDCPLDGVLEVRFQSLEANLFTPEAQPTGVITVPSPDLLGLPIDSAAEDLLFRWYAARIADGWQQLLAVGLTPDQAEAHKRAVMSALNQVGLLFAEPGSIPQGPDPDLFRVIQPEEGQSWAEVADQRPAVTRPLPSSILAAACPGGVFAGPADQELRIIADDPAVSLPLLWSPDGARLAFMTDQPAGYQLELVNWPSWNRVQWGGPGAAWQLQSWSPDGHWLAETRLLTGSQYPQPSVWVQDPDTGQAHEVFQPLYPADVAWSPDGSKIVFVNQASWFQPLQSCIQNTGACTENPASLGSDGGYPAVWLKPVNSLAFRWMVLPGFAPAWSRIEPGKDPRLTFILGGYKDHTARATWIVRIGISDANPGSLRRSIAIRSDVPIGTRSQLNIPEQWQLAWSPDAQNLALIIPQGNAAPGFRLVLVAPATGGDAQVLALRTNANRLGWSPDSRYLVYRDPQPSGSVLVVIDLQTGARATVRGEDWDWSPDGRWLAISQPGLGAYVTTPELDAIHFLNPGGCSGPRWQPPLANSTANSGIVSGPARR